MRICLLIAIACAGCSKPAETVVVEHPTFQNSPIVEHDLAQQKKTIESLTKETRDLSERMEKLEQRVDSAEWNIEGVHRDLQNSK